MSTKEITGNKRKDISTKKLKGKKSYLSDLNLDIIIQVRKNINNSTSKLN